MKVDNATSLLLLGSVVCMYLREMIRGEDTEIGLCSDAIDSVVDNEFGHSEIGGGSKDDCT